MENIISYLLNGFSLISFISDYYASYVFNFLSYIIFDNILIVLAFVFSIIIALNSWIHDFIYNHY